MFFIAGLVGGKLPLMEYGKLALYLVIFKALPVILCVTYVPEFALVLVNILLN